MKCINILKGLCFTVSLVVIGACHEQPEFANTPKENFEALWRIIDQNYCFFEYKSDIDWVEVGNRYRAKVTNGMTPQELFSLCSEMVNELKDGHVNLASSWDVSYYRFWDQYPQNYNARIIEENYLNFNYKTASGIKYMVLPNNFGYMYYGSFSNTIGEGNLDYVLYEMISTDGLIIDVRNNGGGLLPNVETLVARFLDDEILAGAISHKTGPGHNDFSAPFKYYFKPSANGRIRYKKPVVVLTNRSSFSATNNFVSIMQYLPNVKIVGDVTGGGGGLPFTSELPNGWTIRFSACAIEDAMGNITEFGVAPSPGCKVDMSPEEEAVGKDAIIEKAFEILAEMINMQQ
ncbi:MAG: S41 family peptidase [Muribaculaceae bacterium]|nr:S41 family peptidase [Muribaculaceae bacterium]